MTEESILTETKRVCYACDSDETYIDRFDWAHWHSNLPIGWLCNKCYCKHIKNPKISLLFSKQRIKMEPLGKQVYLTVNPKIGVCNFCRAVAPFDCKVTQMHHDEYDISNPLAHTIEACPRCHRFEHNRKN